MNPPRRALRRDPAREREVFNIVLNLVREMGYERLTMDAVAISARCSKATLYRQWASKAALITDAVKALPTPRVDLPDTGSLRGDLLHLVVLMAARSQSGTALVCGLSHAALADNALGNAVRDALVEPYCAALSSVVTRAVERGELPQPPTAAVFLPQVLAGAVLSRPMFEGDFADTDYLTALVDAVILPSLLRR